MMLLSWKATITTMAITLAIPIAIHKIIPTIIHMTTEMRNTMVIPTIILTTVARSITTVMPTRILSKSIDPQLALCPPPRP